MRCHLTDRIIAPVGKGSNLIIFRLKNINNFSKDYRPKLTLCKNIKFEMLVKGSRLKFLGAFNNVLLFIFICLRKRIFSWDFIKSIGLI